MSKVAKVECIQASRCMLTNQKIYTLVCEYPRAVHAQLLTHRVFSKNSSSTRAVPLQAAIQQIRDNPAQVVFTGKQPGMQGPRICEPTKLFKLNTGLELFMEQAIAFVNWLDKQGVHKQNAGRYLESFQNIRIVLTSTEWDNWDWLRVDSAAQPEVQALAVAMKEARDNAEVMDLHEGEWHVPFIERNRNVAGELEYFLVNEDAQGVQRYQQVTAEEAINTSMSSAAQTSFRKADTSESKTTSVLDKLFNGTKVHASPSEHPATPIANPVFSPGTAVSAGVTHMDRDGELWSGNFKNFIQYRQLLPNHDAALMK